MSDTPNVAMIGLSCGCRLVGNREMNVMRVYTCEHGDRCSHVGLLKRQEKAGIGELPVKVITQDDPEWVAP
ncbi:MAG: hypothetical protein WBG86_14555 [Polyangiales bacterium]